MLERNIVIGGVSVCLSVCSSHAGNAAKLMTVGSCTFHGQVAQRLQFFNTNLHVLCLKRNPLQGLQTRLGWVKWRNRRFSPNRSLYLGNDNRLDYSYNGRPLGSRTLVRVSMTLNDVERPYNATSYAT